MNPAVIAMIVNGIVSLMGALPAIQQAIKDMQSDDATKEELIARIKAAQDSLPDWT